MAEMSELYAGKMTKIRVVLAHEFNGRCARDGCKMLKDEYNEMSVKNTFRIFSYAERIKNLA